MAESMPADAIKGHVTVEISQQKVIQNLSHEAGSKEFSLNPIITCSALLTNVVVCQTSLQLRHYVDADCLTLDIGAAFKYVNLERVQCRMVRVGQSSLQLPHYIGADCLRMDVGCVLECNQLEWV
uniref:Uncharacterized protein n=1 Tax=Ascaris lumbricoides TaxID=6252 RepID=A0A9J2PI47_ASCLU